MPGPVAAGGGGGFCDVLCFEYECFAILLGTTINKAYSVVPRVEPALEVLSDELRREEGRFEDRRDPREVGLLVFFPAAGISDSYDVRLRVIGGYLSARAEK